MPVMTYRKNKSSPKPWGSILNMPATNQLTIQDFNRPWRDSSSRQFSSQAMPGPATLLVEAAVHMSLTTPQYAGAGCEK